MDQKEKLRDGNKLINALHELLKENFSVSDDTILDKLYVHIANEDAGGDLLDLILPDLRVWLENVSKLWNYSTLCHGVKVLSIRLIGLVGSKPLGFITVKHILPEIEKLLSSSEVQNDSSFMVPLLNDLALFLNHEEGFDWVLNTGIWKYAVKTYFDNRSIYTNRSGVKFISLLLSKVGSYDEHKGIEILNTICEPLHDNSLLYIKPISHLERHEVTFSNKGTDTNTDIKKKPLIKHLARAAMFLFDILEEFFSLNANLPVKLKCKIANEINLNNCLLPQDYQIFLQLLIMLTLSNMHYDYTSPEDDSQKWASTSYPMDTLCHIVHWCTVSLTSQGHWNCLLDFCVFCLSKVHRFRSNVLHIHINSGCKTLERLLVYRLEMFLELPSKCFHLSPGIFEESFAVEDSGEPFGYKTDSAHLKKFHEIRLSQTLSFQYFQLGVFATLRSLNFISCVSNRNTIISVVIKSLDVVKRHFWSEKVKLNSSLLHLITLASKLLESYTEQFRVLRFEEIELFSSIAGLLENETDDPRITINILQLLNKVLWFQVIPISISLPDIPIVLNNFFSHMKKQMQTIRMSLIKNLKNPSSWGIRDTTLEVYQLVIEFEDLIPELIRMVFHDELYSQVLKLVAEDEVAYVRASAIKFFTKAVRAKVFVDKIPSEDLSDLAIKTLMEDDMPEPRMAACDLLTTMYAVDFLSSQGFEEKLYETLFIVSMKELDWEVKKATLRFWHCAITKKLADEKIPLDPVLLRFSNVSNDIVSKLISVMNALSDIGCFKVILSDLNDHSDISVSEEASRIVNYVEDLDRKWNFIDVIINSFDMEMEVEDLANKKLRPKEFFIYIRQTDWREKLEARKNWIENKCDDLSSLLDHILNPDCNMGDIDHNAVDCY